MYENFEDRFRNRVLVAEIKGLLRELETMVKNIEWCLGSNVSKINDELDQMRRVTNIIEDKIKN